MFISVVLFSVVLVVSDTTSANSGTFLKEYRVHKWWWPPGLRTWSEHRMFILNFSRLFSETDFGGMTKYLFVWRRDIYNNYRYSCHDCPVTERKFLLCTITTNTKETVLTASYACRFIIFLNCLCSVFLDWLFQKYFIVFTLKVENCSECRGIRFRNRYLLR